MEDGGPAGDVRREAAFHSFPAMKDRLDTETLLELLARKDNRAYKYLYERYYVAIRALAFHYVKDTGMAEDLAQDVFIVMLEGNYAFKSEDEIKYFLYRAVRNRCNDYFRREKVKLKYVQDMATIQEDDERFWDEALEEDVYAQLMGAIETLPPRCKLVMQLTLEGMKESEIAEKLKISLPTVKEHKQQGKKSLIDYFKDGKMTAVISFLFI